MAYSKEIFWSDFNPSSFIQDALDRIKKIASEKVSFLFWNGEKLLFESNQIYSREILNDLIL